MNKLAILTIFLATHISILAQKNNNSDITVKKNTARTIHNENSTHFMQFGIVSRNHEEFRKKYGIAVIYQNCVISQFLSQKAKENNQLVAKELTEKHGDVWKKDLGFLPYGL